MIAGNRVNRSRYSFSYMLKGSDVGVLIRDQGRGSPSVAVRTNPRLFY
ncbi:hypothetical protein SAMN05661012_04946 [Chitinophaga sancti]|uniref:Uncharacterized protein n=1 Tax=Chitinophaga sancti TaxID=1004 RepID=A0A1K1S8B1_9BACT|nr:hypothetical protein SAMN05661012_04946 [Chitinophaga sancti]